jgi:hypothetical protein
MMLWLMLEDILRHDDEPRSFITEGMIVGTPWTERGRFKLNVSAK